MIRKELVTAIANKTGETKLKTEAMLLAFQEVITEELAAGEKVQLIGFGSFEVLDRAERIGHHPQTNEPITIKASKLPKFKPGKALRDAVNK